MHTPPYLPPSPTAFSPPFLRILLLSWAAVLALALPGALRGAILVGDVFPSLTTAGLSGPPLAATAGQVVIVDVWASWCAPCRQSFPAYGRLFKDMGPRGLQLVAVSVDQDAGSYDEFVKRFHPGFEVTRDASQTLVRRLEVPTMPTLYVVDRAGRVRYLHRGYHGAQTDAELRTEVEVLLAEKFP
jgi:thiol-disulfide isomerase/thioredoxin